jgi:adenosine 3'-phospho 5'-phosphosulfate transporter B2
MNRGAARQPLSPALQSSASAPDLEADKALLEKPGSFAEEPESFRAKGLKLAACFVGLQGSYVTWGFIQEKVMTQRYDTGMFPSTVFLVCANRALALVVAGALMTYKSRVLRQPAPRAPFYQFSPCSISNIVSSWAQYECLKYVSFPTQTLFKSSKVIPVMLVGKFFHKKNYPWIEYVEAVGITLGVALFMLTEKAKKGGGDGAGDSVLGVLILSVYVFCDSFTSQWQDRVYKTYHVDQYAMMFGVNFFSLTFTACNLLATGEMGESLAFLAMNKAALVNVLTLSFTSATGQLFIFYTIKKFGPIVFTIMMTTRQMLSLTVSCLVFGHSLGSGAVLGTGVVFGVLFSRTKRKFDAVSRASG